MQPAWRGFLGTSNVRETMNDNHKLTFDLKVTPSFNAEDQVLQFETSSHAQVLSREVIRFKEETTRKALIALGWRPPEQVAKTH